MKKQLRITGHRYRIVFDRDQLTPVAGPHWEACIDLINQVIYADPRVSTTRQQENLLHEVLHAIFDLSGLNYCLDEGRPVPRGGAHPPHHTGPVSISSG